MGVYKEHATLSSIYVPGSAKRTSALDGCSKWGFGLFGVAGRHGRAAVHRLVCRCLVSNRPRAGILLRARCILHPFALDRGHLLTLLQSSTDGGKRDSPEKL